MTQMTATGRVVVRWGLVPVLFAYNVVFRRSTTCTRNCTCTSTSIKCRCHRELVPVRQFLLRIHCEQGPATHLCLVSIACRSYEKKPDFAGHPRPFSWYSIGCCATCYLSLAPYTGTVQVHSNDHFWYDGREVSGYDWVLRTPVSSVMHSSRIFATCTWYHIKMALNR
jgi:hypothetical protein